MTCLVLKLLVAKALLLDLRLPALVLSFQHALCGSGQL